MSLRDGESHVPPDDMYGGFGGYTHWSAVILMILVLFILIIPHRGRYSTPSTTSPVFYIQDIYEGDKMDKRDEEACQS